MPRPSSSSSATFCKPTATSWPPWSRSCSWVTGRRCAPSAGKVEGACPELRLDEELRPFADSVDRKFADWVFRHNAQRATAFTPEQMDWLRLMKDHIAASCCIERDDFDYAQLAARGGLQKAWHVFGGELDGLMAGMNEELVA